MVKIKTDKSQQGERGKQDNFAFSLFMDFFLTCIGYFFFTRNFYLFYILLHFVFQMLQNCYKNVTYFHTKYQISQRS